MRLAKVLLALLASLPMTCAARASVYFVDITTGTYKIDGYVATSNTEDSVGGYDVTGITGYVSGPGGGAITGLVANPNGDKPFTGGTNASWIYDNVLFPNSDPVVDNSGILFTAGGYDYNVYSVGTTYYVSTLNPTGGYNPGETLVTADIAAVPELQTWAMMGIGFAGLGLMGYRRRKKSGAAAASA